MTAFSQFAAPSGPAFLRLPKCLPSIVAKTLLGIAICTVPWPGQAQVQKLPMASLSIGPHALKAEVAATDASRQYGLMHRQSLPDDQGMLFVFENIDTPCFW